MNSLFITGATGFIGQRFLQTIDYTRYQKIYCLIRKEGDTAKAIASMPNCQIVIGDLNEPATYAPYLAECQTVVHLAAATGKVKREDYIAVNATGTKALVEQCERHQVKNFLYLSTIAVTYPDIQQYDYALSKMVGEDAVKQSRLNYVIIRPTIVLGKHGKIWETFYKLARLPLLVIPGTGDVHIQPIDLDDLVACLQTMLSKDAFSNQIFELSGAEQITFETFLRRIHVQMHGREPRIIHLPLAPILTVLSLFERYLPNSLPVNSGQLSAFRFDSTSDPQLQFPPPYQMKSLDRMIGDLVSTEMEDERRQALNKECEAFSFYLIRQHPNAYVREKYLEAHQANPDLQSGHRNIFDRFLLAISVKSVRLAKMADSYASIFSRGCPLRKKIVLLLAILESTTPTFPYFDLPQSGGRVFLLFKMLWQGLLFAAVFIVSTLLFFPINLLGRLSKQRR
jgi:NADH dehydrogenase